MLLLNFIFTFQTSSSDIGGKTSPGTDNVRPQTLGKPFRTLTWNCEIPRHWGNQPEHWTKTVRSSDIGETSPSTETVRSPDIWETSPRTGTVRYPDIGGNQPLELSIFNVFHILLNILSFSFNEYIVNKPQYYDLGIARKNVSLKIISKGTCNNNILRKCFTIIDTCIYLLWWNSL